MASMTYSEYLFHKHRWLLVVRRVFPSASLEITDDRGFGLSLRIWVDVQGKRATVDKTLSYVQLKNSDYAYQMFRHSVLNLTSYLLEDAWRKID